MCEDGEEVRENRMYRIRTEPNEKNESRTTRFCWEVRVGKTAILKERTLR